MQLNRLCNESIPKLRDYRDGEKWDGIDAIRTAIFQLHGFEGEEAYERWVEKHGRSDPNPQRSALGIAIRTLGELYLMHYYTVICAE